MYQTLNAHPKKHSVANNIPFSLSHTEFILLIRTHPYLRLLKPIQLLNTHPPHQLNLSPPSLAFPAITLLQLGRSTPRPRLLLPLLHPRNGSDGIAADAESALTVSCVA